jgi:hypothetical protein
MTSFELEIDDKSRVGSEFIEDVGNEIKRALTTERATRKITQQSIADKVGTSRAVINRQIQGLENLTARRIAEILWAIGWEPHFKARKARPGENLFVPERPIQKEPSKPFQPLTQLGSNVRASEIRPE